MKYFFDTEFMEDGKTIELLSIGMVAEDGRELYLENYEADVANANEFVAEHVLPYLGQDLNAVRYRQDIAESILLFTAAGYDVDGKSPEFWAYYAAYDWVVLCQLYGRMVDLPKGWPMFCMDLKQLCVHMGDPRLPSHTGYEPEHHALADARWLKDAHDWLYEWGQQKA